MGFWGSKEPLPEKIMSSVIHEKIPYCFILFSHLFYENWSHVAKLYTVRLAILFPNYQYKCICILKLSKCKIRKRVSDQ